MHLPDTLLYHHNNEHLQTLTTVRELALTLEVAKMYMCSRLTG